MGILSVDFRDSFGAYTLGGTNEAGTYWDIAQVSIGASSGAFGARGALISGSGGLQKNILGNKERVTNLYCIKTATTAFSLLRLNSALRGIGDIGVAIDGSFQVNRGGTSAVVFLGASAAGAFPFGVQNHIEIYHYIDPTVGAYTIYVNGSLVLALTGVNTTSPDAGGPYNSDFPSSYKICISNPGNTTVSHPWAAACSGNVQVGPRRVEFLPANGTGLFAQFTPIGSGNNWDNVDEVPPSSTDYNKSSTVGQRDSFQYASLPATATDIIDVARCSRAFVDDGSAHSLRQDLTSNGTRQVLTTYAVPAIAGYTKYGSIIDPSTGLPWLKPDVDAVDGGYELMS